MPPTWLATLRIRAGHSRCVTGSALWDTVESCDIVGASDSSIRNVVPSDLSEIIRNSQISHIYACGQKADQLFHKYSEPMLECNGIHVSETALPSTSPAYASKTLDQLVDIYRERIFD